MTVGGAAVTVVTPEPGWAARQTLRALAVVATPDPGVAIGHVTTPWVLLAEGPLERHAVKLLLECAEETGADAVVGDQAEDAVAAPADLPVLLDGPRRGSVLWRTTLLADGAAELALGSRASALALLARAGRVATRATPVRSAPSALPTLAEEVRDQAALDAAVPEALRALRDHRVVGTLVPAYLARAAPDDLPAVRGLLAGRSLEPVRALPPALRVAVYHLMIGADAEVRDALLWAGPEAVLGADIRRAGDREHWACEHLADGPSVDGRTAAEWLDVTDAHPSLVPPDERRPLHEIAGSGLALRTRGIEPGERVLVATLAGGGEAARYRHDGRRWQPQEPARLVRRLRPDDAGVVVVEQAGTRAPLLAPAGAGPATLPFRGRRGPTGPDALRLEASADGVVRWRAVSSGRARRAAAALLGAWRRVPGAAALAESARVAWQHTLPQWWGRRGPRPRPRVVLETESGRAASGDVRALSEWLHEHRPDLPQAWVVRDDAGIAPPYAEAVERQSRRHHVLLNRSAFAVDDGTTSLWLDPPPRLRTVLAGPGVPVHRMGRDDPSLLVRGPAVRTLARRYRRYAAALAPGAGSGAVIGSALALAGPVVPVGLPRVERVLRLRETGRPSGLPADRPAVLYVPTVRRASREAVDPPLDLEAWAATWGESLYLLVHPHPQQPLRVPRHLRWAVRDLADATDLAPWWAAAALVVSDYSSLIGDAVLLDVPVILHQPDRRTYLARTRGVYRTPGAAGPVTETTVDLDREVGAWLADPDAWRDRFAADRAEFAAHGSRPVDGGATRRAAEVLLGGAP
jgi:hypothetical protein